MPDEAPETTAPQSLAERLDLQQLIGGLLGDLRDLRAGKISVRDARARAELARQILRGVHYVVIAQKFLEAKALPAPDGESPPRRRNRKS